MPCPRWDSNGILGLAIAGQCRKHAESGPVRRLYEAVRAGKCGQCPHSLFCPSTQATRNVQDDVPDDAANSKPGVGRAGILQKIRGRKAFIESPPFMIL